MSDRRKPKGRKFRSKSGKERITKGDVRKWMRNLGNKTFRRKEHVTQKDIREWDHNLEIAREDKAREDH